MWKKIFRPHSIIVTCIIFAFIGFLEVIRLNTHFLDPFNYGIKEYEITDIVYTQLSRPTTILEDKVVLVNIGKPDRGELAQLIDRLAGAGAKVIGVDVLLEGKKEAAMDLQLSESIKKAGNVVLASELYKLVEEEKQFERLNTADSLFAAYAQTGYINFPSNHTKTIRYFSPKESIKGGTALAFSMAILQHYDPTIAQACLDRNKELMPIHYLGNRDNFIRFEKEVVLDTTVDLSGVINDKIILIGYVPENEWDNPLLDRFYTPLNKEYARRSVPDMFGVVIHANIISMVLNKRYIRETPKWLVIILSVLFCYANVFFIHGIYASFHPAFHGITRSLQLVECMVLFFLIGVLFYYFRISFDFGTGILALLLAYDIIMIYESFFLKKLAFLQKIKDNF
ncbi:MAG: CHASE2 domain-containing protein [Saprospiraceae bacterium]